MYVLKDDFTEELVIKNSRFITILKKTYDIDDIENEIKKIKEMYPKATHYPYAYIINNIKKSSDDNEPGGTAGIPILNILEKESIDNILVVVVRYFGGIKLGTGGLVRAYTKSLKNYIKNNELIEQIEGKKVEIEFDYKDEKQINYLLKEIEIIKKEFKDKITYTILIPDDKLDILSSYTYQIIDNIFIEKRS